MAVTDNFNRADGGLGANWATGSGFGALSIVSNTCKGSGSGVHNVGFYTAGGTIPADQYAQCKVTTTGSYMGTVLRSDGVSTFYVCFYQPSAANATIYKVVAGSFSSVATGSVMTPTVNDVIYFEVVGNVLTFKINGVVVATGSDSTITGAGYTGIDIFETTGVIDDFEGGATAVDVSVSLTGVAADPQIGAGTVEIGAAPVEPPVGPGGGTGAGRPARTGMRLRPTEDKFVYLKGVAANPQVGQVMLLSEMRGVYEKYVAPIRRVEAQKTPKMPAGMRGLFKKVEKPIPPAVFVYQVGLPKLKSAVGTMTVKAFYEEVDEEVVAMIDLL